MSKEATSSGPTFWLDEDKGRKLALFQDRVSAVGGFLERCRRRFANIYKAMFPLNPPVESFKDLMQKFGSMAGIRSLLRAQITAGAQLGLTFVRVRHPDLDMDVVSRFPFIQTHTKTREKNDACAAGAPQLACHHHRKKKKDCSVRNQSSNYLPTMSDTRASLKWPCALPATASSSLAPNCSW